MRSATRAALGLLLVPGLARAQLTSSRDTGLGASALADSSAFSSGLQADSASSEGDSLDRTPGSLGLRYTLEGVEVRGNTTTLSWVVLRYVPFHAGDVLDVDNRALTLTRFRLLGTGYFRDVQLSLRRGTHRGAVILVVSVVERNTMVVDDVWLGLSADVDPVSGARPITAYAGVRVTETNLGGTGIALGGAFAVADSQLALRARLADPQFLRSSWIAETEILYNNARDFFGNRDVQVEYAAPPEAPADYAVAQYVRFGGRVGAGHDLGISSQLFFDYRLEKIRIRSSACRERLSGSRCRANRLHAHSRQQHSFDSERDVCP